MSHQHVFMHITTGAKLRSSRFIQIKQKNKIWTSTNGLNYIEITAVKFSPQPEKSLKSLCSIQ